MGESRDDPTIYWVDPDKRGVLPLDRFHVPRSLRKRLRRGGFEIRVDSAFADVIGACAEPAPGRQTTWINGTIERLYTDLHLKGYAHSVECWEDEAMVGGLYGVALGGAFFGESMFARRPDASKVALVHLVERLRIGGYELLDTQFVTEHLARFGATEIPRAQYLRRLSRALKLPTDFYSIDSASGRFVAAASSASSAASRHSRTITS
jgi:leucyl/phenylalanyl-tRNA--protein transferase